MAATRWRAGPRDNVKTERESGTIELTKVAVQELKNLLANRQRLERTVRAAVVELARGGAATGSDDLTPEMEPSQRL